MKFSQRQKLFIIVTPIAALIAVCSHINVLGLPTQSHVDLPDASLSMLIADNKQSNTPEAIGRACLPQNEATGAELIGTYRNPTTTQLFQIWRMYITPDHPVLRIHGIYGIGGPDGTVCLLAYDERYDQTLGENISEEDARQVALVVWQYRVDAIGGVEAMQVGFNNTAAELAQYGETGYVSAEDQWALETLGIQIPSLYQVYDPDNPPEITDSDRGEI